MTRIGFGYDLHRLETGGPMLLGGVKIDSDKHLVGHSDADAVLHAITDAILGAVAAGDIGELFPDTDPALAGADSAAFVRRAVQLAAEAGARVGNCDVTVIAEAPKLFPHKQAMRERIAALLDVDVAAIAIKAKTNEGLGPAGRGQALIAMAAVSMVAT